MDSINFFHDFRIVRICEQIDHLSDQGFLIALDVYKFIDGFTCFFRIAYHFFPFISNHICSWVNDQEEHFFVVVLKQFCDTDTHRVEIKYMLLVACNFSGKILTGHFHQVNHVLCIRTSVVDFGLKSSRKTHLCGRNSDSRLCILLQSHSIVSAAVGQINMQRF